MSDAVVVDGIKIMRTGKIQFSVKHLVHGCYLRYGGVMCSVRYPLIAHEPFGAYAIRVNEGLFVRFDDTTVLDSMGGMQLVVPAGLPRGMSVRVSVTGGMRRLIYPRDFVRYLDVPDDAWPGVDMTMPVPAELNTIRPTRICGDCATVHPLLCIMQWSVDAADIGDIVTTDEGWLNDLFAYVRAVVTERRGVRVRDTATMWTCFMLCAFVIFTKSVGNDGDVRTRVVLNTGMKLGRNLIVRMLNDVRGGLADGRVCVLQVLRLHVQTWSLVRDDEFCAWGFAGYLHVYRETMADVLVKIPWVLGTALGGDLGMLCHEHHGVMSMGDMYIWASQLRDYFIVRLGRQWDPTPAALNPRNVMRDKRFVYESGDVLWTRLYERLECLLRGMCDYYSKSYLIRVRGRYGDSTDYLEGPTWHRDRNIEYAADVCDGPRMHLLRTYMGLSGDWGDTGAMHVDELEVERRIRFAATYLIGRGLLDGPVHRKAVTFTTPGRLSVGVSISMYHDTKCLSLDVKCRRDGHADRGDLYLSSHTHAGKWPTRVRAYSWSSKHACAENLNGKKTLAEITVEMVGDVLEVKKFEQF